MVSKTFDDLDNDVLGHTYLICSATKLLNSLFIQINNIEVSDSKVKIFF